MEQEILQQILAEIKELKTDVKETKQKVINLELTIENEIRHDIKIIAENHLSLNQKLDTLKGIDERVSLIQDDITVLKSITKDNLYDLKALKVVR